VKPGQPVQPWEIRDSNGPMLQAMIESMPYLQLTRRESVMDDADQLRVAIESMLRDCDVLLLTGGVSAGDFDYVPQTLQSLGVSTQFHRLPIKPGKPIFVGIGSAGQLVCGLPGNPVSVAVTSRRIAIPLVQFIAGQNEGCLAGRPTAYQLNADANRDSLHAVDLKGLPLIKYHLVRRNQNGQLVPDTNKGSGDIVSLGHSNGFIEYNPFLSNPVEAMRYYDWKIDV
jgi:molybdopterin molybdotransferase